VLFFGADEVSLTANQKIEVGPPRELAQGHHVSERGVIDGVRSGGRSQASQADSIFDSNRVGACYLLPVA